MKIAIVRLSAMGDILHALWHIDLIKKAYPDAKIDLFVDERFYFLVKDLVWFDEVISLPLKKSFFKALKILKSYKHKYDISIDYQGRVKSAYVTSVLSTMPVGYAKNGLREKLAYYFYKKHCSCDYLENVYKRSLELTYFALEKTKDYEPSYSDILIYKQEKQDELMQNIKEFIKEKFILVHNGSSKESKMYPLENYKQVCKEFELLVLLSWGNELELNRAKEIAKVCKKAIVLPKLSLNELAYLTKFASLVIGNDSGTTHIANVSGVASILFLNENAKKPAIRFISMSDKNKYFPSFESAKPELVIKCANELLEIK